MKTFEKEKVSDDQAEAYIMSLIKKNSTGAKGEKVTISDANAISDVQSSSNALKSILRRAKNTKDT
jgi:non-homologous end joining protein Ku